MKTCISSDMEIVEQNLTRGNEEKNGSQRKDITPQENLRAEKQLLEIAQTIGNNPPLISSSMLEEVSSKLIEVHQYDGDIEALICSSGLLNYEK